MELKDFISETLVNILDGVQEANNKHQNKFKIIGEYARLNNINGGVNGNYVDFDITILVNESQDQKEKARIGVLTYLGIGIGAEASKESKQQESVHNNHKLKFKVFIES